MKTERVKHCFFTNRIVLINASVPVLQNIINGDEALKEFLQISIPGDWTEFGQAPFKYALERIQKQGSDARWWSWLPILVSENKLIGNCGYKGAPKKGIVEIGYEIAKDYRGRGYATEIAGGLIRNAFKDEAVQEVIAHTLAVENASVKVLRKYGFTFTEQINDPEDGQIWKWVLSRHHLLSENE